MWPHGTDPIWSSPNLRRFSLRTNNNNHKCSWEPSADKKFLIGYIDLCKQDLDVHSLGFTICANKSSQGNYGALVTHVVPGSIMNIICKLKVGDQIAEFNGLDLRNKSDEEVNRIIESAKSCNSLRLVAVRPAGNYNENNN